MKSHANVAHNQTIADATTTNSTSPISISVMTSSSASSSLSSLINSPNASSICGGDSSSNSSTVSNSNNLSATAITKNNNNNYSLITIKTKPTLVKAHSGKDFCKLMMNQLPDEGNIFENDNNEQFLSTMLEINSSSTSTSSLQSVTTASPGGTATVKMTLPSLMNLGILTPATSPSQQHQQQQQNQQSVIQSLTINSDDSGISSGGTMPLTPISPNMSKNINFVTSNEIMITEQT